MILNNLADWDQKAEAGTLNDSDIVKREERIMDLHYFYQLERYDLKQKSRVKWAIEGDENTRYFLSLLRNRFANFSIKGIHVNGIWLSPEDASFLDSSFSINEAYWEVIEADFIKCIKYFESTGNFANGCNPSLIVISKLLAMRLAKVISSIIGPNQKAFLAGRQILDENLIANEDVMIQMGFGVKWRRWIDSCLSSASISVLINRSPSKEFKMKRGLRQGDPLSPFLFLLVAEVLQVAMAEACNKGLNARNLIIILKCFEEASGLKVNLAKSKLYGVGVSIEEVEAVASLLCCIHDSIPFTYLGLPVGRKMHFCDGLGEVINRLRDRLTAWKARSLSIRGRLTLIKSVLGSIPIYFLSLFKAHVKSQVGSLFVKNLSLINKWKWRFLTEENALWRKVIKAFDGVDGGFNLHPSSIGGRGVWCDIIKSILYIESIDPGFNDSFILKVGNGKRTSFWLDPWCGNGVRLKDLFSRLYALDTSQECKVYIEDKWTWSRDASSSFKVKVNIYVWRAFINRLATRTNLAMRGIDIPSTLFLLCDSAEESIEHCLISCSRVLPIWKKVWSWWQLDPPALFPSFSIADIALGRVGNHGQLVLDKIIHGVF
ncbi:putative RNA-directed DNA polymerase, eukaryota, reverse transcriptase zinc-binding domain protein [Tanacetum coccineum]